MSELAGRSGRWRSAPDADIDAFLLTDGSWLLFAYVKDPRLADDEGYWTKLAAAFRAGPVAVIGRALKTEKGSEPLPPFVLDAAAVASEFWAREGWLKYRLECVDVLNPGLFLDQTGNRVRLAALIEEFIGRSKGVFTEQDGLLNLFSYTGAFSMAAFGAGVRAVTSVDVSARYLAWERANFEANFGGQDQLSHRLLKDDARDVLRRSAAKGARFRWIIIDPPTFSRGQGKPFKVRDELPGLVEAAARVLAPGGAILASCNDSRWSARDFEAELSRAASAAALGFERGRAASGFPADHALKSAWLTHA